MLFCFFSLHMCHNKTHGKSRWRPRLSVIDRFLNIRIGELFTAVSVNLSGGSQWLIEEEGMTLTSEPVSTRNCVCVLVSLT